MRDDWCVRLDELFAELKRAQAAWAASAGFNVWAPPPAHKRAEGDPNLRVAYDKAWKAVEAHVAKINA